MHVALALAGNAGLAGVVRITSSTHFHAILLVPFFLTIVGAHMCDPMLNLCKLDLDVEALSSAI